ncbi:MAG: DNA/RNA nuclease SfsA [Asgard group archaeon]|nr:DNA/RNA nuclease SfsA [Asgard group archaeon]
MQKVITTNLCPSFMENKEILVEGIVSFATFYDRPNRFLVNLIPDGSKKTDKAFLHDPGRMKELLVPNARLLIREPLNKKDRKTKWDVLAVEYQGKIVVIKSSLPNVVAKTALINGWISELTNYEFLRSEVPYGSSRLDFLLEKDEQKCYVEVKGVTLVNKNTALFPDAPTTRGTRHLHELIKIVREGNKGVAFFICMRDDPINFTPNKETDPDFSSSLIEAVNRGVDILVYKVKPIIRNQQLILQFKDKIKVNLNNY